MEKNHSRIMKIKYKGSGNPMWGKKGEKAGNWRGGRQHTTDGYVLLYMPNHPYCNKAGYYPEHRHVAEKILKRILDPTEIVHHIGKKNDNRLKMLYLFSSDSGHKKYHAFLRNHDNKGKFLKSNIVNYEYNLNIKELILAHNKTFISFEPLLENVGKLDLTDISWIIIGTMTGPGSKKYQPKPEWIENILRQADKYKLPVFMKNNLKPIWKGKLRQEFPVAKGGKR